MKLKQLSVYKDRLIETIEKHPESKEVLESLFPEIKGNEDFFCLSTNLLIIRGRKSILKMIVERVDVPYDLNLGWTMKISVGNIMVSDRKITTWKSVIYKRTFDPSGDIRLTVADMEDLMEGQVVDVVKDVKVINKDKVESIFNHLS